MMPFSVPRLCYHGLALAPRPGHHLSALPAASIPLRLWKKPDLWRSGRARGFSETSCPRARDHHISGRERNSRKSHHTIAGNSSRVRSASWILKAT